MMGVGSNGYPAPAGAGGGYDAPEGVEIRGRYDQEYAKILSKEALQFVAELQREFRNRIKYALECRKEAKRRYSEGGVPGFDPATKFVREGDWVCAPVPKAVADREWRLQDMWRGRWSSMLSQFWSKSFHGEHNAADFEDALSPSWENLIRGQVNLKDAVDGSITFHDKARNRVYKLNDRNIAKLF
ncbi:hypothetical protein ACLB2K_051655 [Fragaria x ananassa]